MTSNTKPANICLIDVKRPGLDCGTVGCGWKS